MVKVGHGFIVTIGSFALRTNNCRKIIKAKILVDG
jgi:hypothetical protein